MSKQNTTGRDSSASVAAESIEARRGRTWRAAEPYLYLLLLAFLSFEPVFAPGRYLLPTLALVAVFLPLYVASMRWTERGEDRAKLHLGVAAMAVLGIVGVAFGLNTNSTIFLIYAAAAATRNSTPKETLAVVGLALAILAVLFFLADAPLAFRWASFLPALLLIPAISATQLFEAERRRHETRLRLSQDEVKRLAAVAERERISRDLHDLLGHTLSTITLKSALAARVATENPARARVEMREVETISRDSLEQVREAVRGYRASGLAEEIPGVRKALSAADIAFELNVEPVDLAPEQESALALALREAATNILRHSGATKVEATLVAEDGHIVLTVVDNGIGGGDEGFGLAGIRSRVQALGGGFCRNGDGGTTLTVRLPKHPPAPAAEGTGPS